MLLLIAIVVILVIEKRHKPDTPPPDYDDVSLQETQQTPDGRLSSLTNATITSSTTYENIHVNGGFVPESEENKTIIHDHEKMNGHNHATYGSKSDGETETSEVEHSTPPNRVTQPMSPVNLQNSKLASTIKVPPSPHSSKTFRLNYDEEELSEPPPPWNSVKKVDPRQIPSLPMTPREAEETHIYNDVPDDCQSQCSSQGSRFSHVSSLIQTKAQCHNSFPSDSVMIDNEVYEGKQYPNNHS